MPQPPAPSAACICQLLISQEHPDQRVLTRRIDLTRAVRVRPAQTVGSRCGDGRDKGDWSCPGSYTTDQCTVRLARPSSGPEPLLLTRATDGVIGRWAMRATRL
jgi:hypothetical protein